MRLKAAEKSYGSDIWDGAMREVDVISESGKTYQTGDHTVITRYQNGTLYIQ